MIGIRKVFPAYLYWKIINGLVEKMLLETYSFSKDSASSM